MTSSKTTPRIAILGAGAIGSYAGAYLARAGHDVTLIDPYHAHIEAIRADGLTVREMDHEFTSHPSTMHIGDVQRLAAERPLDIAILTMKSYDTDWMTMLARRYLASDGYILSMQNCLNEDRIAAIVGRDRVLGCVATYSAELIAPALVSRGNPRGQSTVFAVGELDGQVTPRAEALAALLNDIDRTAVTTALLSERWSKLIINAMRNGISALTGLSVSECDKDPDTRKLAYAIVREAVAVAQKLAIPLKSATNLDLERLAMAGSGDPEAFQEIEAQLAANLATRSAGARASMGQDIIKGRQTEIEFINGYISDRAQELGLTAPVNRGLTDMVLQVYRGEIQQDPVHARTLLELAEPPLRAL